MAVDEILSTEANSVKRIFLEITIIYQEENSMKKKNIQFNLGAMLS